MMSSQLANIQTVGTSATSDKVVMILSASFMSLSFLPLPSTMPGTHEKKSLRVCVGIMDITVYVKQSSNVEDTVDFARHDARQRVIIKLC